MALTSTLNNGKVLFNHSQGLEVPLNLQPPILYSKQINNPKKKKTQEEENIVSWEPEGRYCKSKMFRWEPEGRYCH